MEQVMSSLSGETHSSRGRFGRYILLSDVWVEGHFGTNKQHAVMFLFLNALKYFIIALE